MKVVPRSVLVTFYQIARGLKGFCKGSKLRLGKRQKRKSLGWRLEYTHTGEKLQSQRLLDLGLQRNSVGGGKQAGEEVL